MVVIEHRRHAMRTRPGKHLSQAGVDLARTVGLMVGPFDRVVTSTRPRAIETAIAMGFAVDEQREALADLPDGITEAIDWGGGFGPLAKQIRDAPSSAVARFAGRLADLLQGIAAEVPAEGTALVISHGGIVEAAAIGCRPWVNYETWGEFCRYCEGVQLYFEGTSCERVELLRLDE